MKLHTWSRKLASLSLVLCLGAAVLTGCGSSSKSAASTVAANEEAAEAEDTANTVDTAAENAETEDTAEELQEYVAEGVGTFYLPGGFEMETGTTEEGLPMTWAVLTKDSITVSASRFGADACEAARIPLPADVEEYSQRDGVRQGLPEGAEFLEDSYGNTYVEYTLDGEVTYNVLKMSDEACGGINITYPEGEEAPDCGLWASKFVLD